MLIVVAFSAISLFFSLFLLLLSVLFSLFSSSFEMFDKLLVFSFNFYHTLLLLLTAHLVSLIAHVCVAYGVWLRKVSDKITLAPFTTIFALHQWKLFDRKCYLKKMFSLFLSLRKCRIFFSFTFETVLDDNSIWLRICVIFLFFFLLFYYFVYIVVAQVTAKE